MAKKRGRPVRKTSGSRNSKSKRKSRSPYRSVDPKSNNDNIRLVGNNLVIFFLLFVISIILTQVFSYSIVFQNLFVIFTIAFAFIAIAFLITLLVFLFIKILRKG